MMMYSHLTLRYRLRIRLALATAWVFAAAGGAAALAFPPQTITSELGHILVTYWGASTVLASLIAAIGVAFNRYRLEWAAAWFAFMGMAPYVISLWALVITSSPSRLSQAFLGAALLMMFATRAILCGAHASKLREESKTA